MRVITFQPRFAPGVEARTKLQTMRKRAGCKAGDVLSLRVWTGKPYRSKQREIGRRVCQAVKPVRIYAEPDGRYVIWVNNEPVRDRDAFARADGFVGLEDMVTWLLQNHGPDAFEGWLIEWGSPEAKSCALCGDTHHVNVIPRGGTVNDVIRDECPWCLRRMMLRAPLEPLPFLPPPPHAYKPNRKYPWFCAECGYAPHDVIKHVQPVVWPERREEHCVHGFCPCGVRLTKKTKPFGYCVRCQGSGLRGGVQKFCDLRTPVNRRV